MFGQGDWAVPPVPLELFCKGSGRLREHCEESSWLDGLPQKELQKESIIVTRPFDSMEKRGQNVAAARSGNNSF